jgi:hypothetical protein
MALVEPLKRDPNLDAAGALAPVVDSLVRGRLPVRLELWDGSGIGPLDGPGTLRVRSIDALRRIL